MTTAKPKPAPAPDTADLPAPVDLLTRMVKAGIRLIPDPGTRQACWSVFLDQLEHAQLRDTSRMPWEASGEVTMLPRRVMRDIAVAVIRACPDDDVAARMVKVMERIGDDFEKAQSRSPTASKLPPQQCARPGCSVTFIPGRPGTKYHSDNCRQAHYQMRKKAKADVAQAG
jgi:hypothetical protein